MAIKDISSKCSNADKLSNKDNQKSNTYNFIDMHEESETSKKSKNNFLNLKTYNFESINNSHHKSSRFDEFMPSYNNQSIQYGIDGKVIDHKQEVENKVIGRKSCSIEEL